MSRIHCFALASVCLVVSIFTVTMQASRKADPRILAAKTAFVVAAVDEQDARDVAACLADHLPKDTPLEMAASKETADVILRVKAHITSGATRILLGSMGGTPSATLDVTLPDGTVLWADGAKYRRGNGAVGVAATDPKCGLADGLIGSLRTAVRKVADNAKW